MAMFFERWLLQSPTAVTHSVQTFLLYICRQFCLCLKLIYVDFVNPGLVAEGIHINSREIYWNCKNLCLREFRLWKIELQHVKLKAVEPETKHSWVAGAKKFKMLDL